MTKIGILTVLLRVLDFLLEFFLLRFDFFPPPVTAPGSPRMIQTQRCVALVKGARSPGDVVWMYHQII